MLRTVRTVIVDEIHAVIGTRRGAHLALSLERLQQVAERPLLRIGLSATQKPIDEVARFLTGGVAVRDRRRGAPPRDGSGDRAAALAARSGHGARGVGGVLRSPRRADPGAPDDARLRQHAPDGGARRAAPDRSARRGRGDGAPRQPREGDAPRRREPAESRRAVARSSRPRRSSSASTSVTSISSARSARRTGSPRCCSASGDRATRSAARRRDGCSRRRATTWSSAPRCCAPSAAASSTRSCRRIARSTCWRSRSSPSARAATTPRTSCSRWSAAPGRTAS